MQTKDMFHMNHDYLQEYDLERKLKLVSNN